MLNVADFGAVGDSSTDNRAAFVAADAQAQLVNGAAIYVPAAARGYVLATNTTITSPIMLAAGALLQPAAGTTLTLNGAVNSPSTAQVFGGLGTVVISRIRTPVVHATWFAGADIGAKINNAVTALTVGAQKGPGTIKVNANGDPFTTQINLTSTKGLRLTSEGGNPNATTDYGPALIYTPTGTTAAVDASSSIGLEWDHLNLYYTSATFTGKLFKLNNAAEPHIHHARLAGDTGKNGAAMLIELSTTLGFSIDHATLDHAAIGIGCSGGSNNGIHIGEGMWFDRDFTDCQIKGWGGAWNLRSVIAESGNNAVGVAVVPFVKLAGDIAGLSIDGCMCIDGGSGGGTLIDLQGFLCSGFKLDGGNYTVLAGATSTLVRASDTANSTAGVSVQGVYASGFGTGVHLGRSHGSLVKGNVLKCGTPWTGSEPTGYEVANNDYGTNTISGVSVANTATIPITLPGSPNDGRGLVFVWVTEENASAIYMLNGAAGGVYEISDPTGGTGIFTPTVTTANSINIYWDAGTNSYRLENKRGGTRTIAVTSFLPT